MNSWLASKALTASTGVEPSGTAIKRLIKGTSREPPRLPLISVPGRANRRRGLSPSGCRSIHRDGSGKLNVAAKRVLSDRLMVISGPSPDRGVTERENSVGAPDALER